MVQQVKNQADLEAALKEAGEKLVIIDFFAIWCGPCRTIAPTFAKLASENINVVFLKVDVDEAEDCASTYGVEVMPSFIFMKNGRKIHEIKGASESKLREAIATFSSASSISSSSTPQVPQVLQVPQEPLPSSSSASLLASPPVPITGSSQAPSKTHGKSKNQSSSASSLASLPATITSSLQAPSRTYGKSKNQSSSTTITRVLVQQLKNIPELLSILKEASEKMVVISFYVDWCRNIVEFLKKIAQENTDVVFLGVDGDQSKDFSSAHGVEVMPSLIFMKRGEKIHEMKGASETKLREAIATHK